jgi:D-alanyl-D-alanine carboxypeptidase
MKLIVAALIALPMLAQYSPPSSGGSSGGGTSSPADPQDAPGALALNTATGPAYAQFQPGVAIIDTATGKLIYGRNAYMGTWGFSVTKLMTALVAAEYNPALTDVVTVTSADMMSDGGWTTCRISAGMTVTLFELMKGLLVVSGCDCGQAIGRWIGKTYLGGNDSTGRALFIARMNTRMTELATEMGVQKHTLFKTTYAAWGDSVVDPGTGLLNGHFLAPYDMALVMRKIVLTQPTALSTMASGETLIKDTGGNTFFAMNLPSDLSAFRCIPGVIAAKEGAGAYGTSESIVIAAQRGTESYIIAGLNYQTAAQREMEAISLIEWAFRNNTTAGVTAVCEDNSDMIDSHGGYTADVCDSYETCSGHSQHYNGSTNATIIMPFFGSGIAVYGSTGTGGAKAGFSLDQGAETVIDTYYTSNMVQKIYELTGLTVGWHYLTMRNAGAGQGGGGNGLDYYTVTH